jgi:hypothetical protein
MRNKVDLPEPFNGVISYGKDFASAFALLTKALLDAKQI